MTAKKKKRRQGAAAPKRPRRRRRKSASKVSTPKRRKRAGGGRTTRLKVDVSIPASMRLDGPELGQLSAAQRLELASMGQRKRVSLMPSWASDERTWRKSARLLSRSWKRYEHPYAAVALLYLRSGGIVGSAHRAGPGPGAGLRPGARRKPGGGGGGGGAAGGLEVERVHVDELGYAEDGNYYGPGEPLWRVTSGADSALYVDTVVRARTASSARAMVAQQYGH